MSDVPTTQSRRPLMIAGAVLGGLILLAALWFLVLSPLLAGDSEEAEFDPRAGQPDVTVTEPAGEATEETEEDILAALPVETYEIFLSRDPFEPVIPAPAGDGGADADGDGVPDIVVIDEDGDGVPDDGDGDGVPDDGDGGETVDHNAVLIDVFVDDSGETRALIRVDDRIYTVGEGDIFADGYAVVAIDGTCVTLTFNGATFTLCEGGTAPPGEDGGDGGDDGTDTGPCRGDGEVVCDGRVVTLIDVYVGQDGTPVAVVQVDSTLYEVRRGDTFAQNFQVISIDPPCVTLLYGDDAFTLCEGQRTLK